MINVQELRIGNLISDYQNNTIKVLGISDVYNDGNYYIISENGGSIDDDHKPIPLTPEILLKCGFTKGLSEDDAERVLYSIKVANNTSLYFDRHNNWMRNDEEVVWYLSYEWNNNHHKNDFWAAPQYLHQLQNLFYSLTNEELNINL